MCITRLDVLDELETIKIAVAYRLDGEQTQLPPTGADQLEHCEPVYEKLPGWKQSTKHMRDYEELPLNAKGYLNRIRELCGVPFSLISVGPERQSTIWLQEILIG